MKGKERQIFYFNKPSFANTDEVVEIVYKRLKEGDIKSVVVNSQIRQKDTQGNKLRRH